MWHRSRLTDAIEIRAGESSRTITPGQRVDLAAEILPGVALAQVVRLEWFEPEAEGFQDFGAGVPVERHGVEPVIEVPEQGQTHEDADPTAGA